MNVFHHELTRKKVPEDVYDTLIDQLAVVEGKALQMIARLNR